VILIVEIILALPSPWWHFFSSYGDFAYAQFLWICVWLSRKRRRQ